MKTSKAYFPYFFVLRFPMFSASSHTFSYSKSIPHGRSLRDPPFISATASYRACTVRVHPPCAASGGPCARVCPSAHAKGVDAPVFTCACGARQARARFVAQANTIYHILYTTCYIMYAIYYFRTSSTCYIAYTIPCVRRTI